MITGIQDVSVSVANMRRAVSFYGDVLGMRLVYESPEWSTFDLGGVRFALHGTGGAEVGRVDLRGGLPSVGALVTFRVQDIFTVVDHLRTQGVKFIGDIEPVDGGSAIAFRDLDGNVLRLVQPSGY